MQGSSPCCRTNMTYFLNCHTMETSILDLCRWGWTSCDWTCVHLLNMFYGTRGLLVEVVPIVECQQQSSPAVEWTDTLVLTYLLNLPRVSSPSYTLVTASAGGLNHLRGRCWHYVVWRTARVEGTTGSQRPRVRTRVSIILLEAVGCGQVWRGVGTARRHFPRHASREQQNQIGSGSALDQVNKDRATRCTSGTKTIKKNTNSTQNKSQTHRAKQ